MTAAALGRGRRILESFLKTGRVPQALLFSGPAGAGKEEAAELFTLALSCRDKPTDFSACRECPQCRAALAKSHPDVKFVDFSFQSAFLGEDASRQASLKVDTVRALRLDMERTSVLGGWKIAVIEPAESLEPAAANALLKIVEEPPPSTLWILLASAPERVASTLASRCVKIPFAGMSEARIDEALRARRAAESGGPVSEDDRVWTAAASRLSEGSLSRAWEILQVLEEGREKRGGPILADPFEEAESLSSDLPSARREAGLRVFMAAQELRLGLLAGEVPFARAKKALGPILAASRALRSNADPRISLLVALLAREAALG